MTNSDNSNSIAIHRPLQQTCLHGSKADLKLGDLIEIGFYSNCKERNANISVTPVLLAICPSASSITMRN
jgi:hypothetical protein